MSGLPGTVMSHLSLAMYSRLDDGKIWAHTGTEVVWLANRPSIRFELCTVTFQARGAGSHAKKHAALGLRRQLGRGHIIRPLMIRDTRAHILFAW